MTGPADFRDGDALAEALAQRLPDTRWRGEAEALLADIRTALEAGQAIAQAHGHCRGGGFRNRERCSLHVARCAALIGRIGKLMDREEKA